MVVGHDVTGAARASRSVLVAGAEGYLGTVLCHRLAQDATTVGLDAGFYSDGYIYAPPWDMPAIVRRDVRAVELVDLGAFTDVVCLADLNDPTSQAMPEVTRAINRTGLARFATLCKEAGVRRFVYASSASVYGRSDGTPLREDAPLRPQTPYAEFKVRMEDHLLELADASFRVACLRNATIYGLSPRMRFDLVVNYLCASAVTEGRVELSSDGRAWRPFVHVEDVVEVIAGILALRLDAVDQLVVNVGDGARGNLRVVDVATMVGHLAGCSVRARPEASDARSYCLDTTKLAALDLRCERDIRRELSTLMRRLSQLQLTRSAVQGRAGSRLEQLRHLLRTGRVDSDLRWIAA